MYGFGYDPTFILLIPAMILAFYAQIAVKTTFGKYLKVNTTNGYSGYEAARVILERNGLNDVRVEITNGYLGDHYDPRSRVLRLSNEVYYGKSISSVSVASHECGHAIQHDKGYFPLIFRNALVPVANFGSNVSWIFIMLGFIISTRFLDVGILLFLGVVMFQIITLPVEFNASSRAIENLISFAIVDSREEILSKRVLRAAALTYIAAAATSLLQLVRLIILRNNREE